MHETIGTPPTPQPRASGSTDKHAFAQVEKWLALIREIAREQAKAKV